MLRLRPYKHCDSERIARWVADEDVFHLWGGDLFGPFPVTADVIDRKYTQGNGGCEEPDNFYPWIAFNEEDKAVGQFIMRYLQGNRRILRFGWVVVDPAIRGKGVGTEMMRAGLKYAFEIFGAEKVTLGVFEGNEPAHQCYRKAGFSDREILEKESRNQIEMEIGKEAYLRLYGSQRKEDA